jgi:hypothetical protein
MAGPFVQSAALMVLASRLFAQGSIAQQLDPLSTTPNSNGIHLYGVTFGAEYFSGNNGSIPGLPLFYGTGATQILTGVVSTSLGWSWSKGKNKVSVTYSPSFVHGFYFKDFSAFNQAFSVNASRSLGFGSGRWRVSGSGSGNVIDYRELLFAPTQYGNITGTSATYDEFASAILTGTTSNQALASIVSTPQAVTGPQSAYLYGVRLLSITLQMGLSYHQSSRSSFQFGVSGMRNQSLPSSGEIGYDIPNSTYATANLGWSYSISPRTTFGAYVSTSRTFSRYLDGYLSQAGISLGRAMSRRWFVQSKTGVGYIKAIHETVLVSQKPQYLFTGSLGFKTYTQTFLGSYSRAVGDIYGAGANATDNAMGSWRWRKPGYHISFFATCGYMRLLGSGLPHLGSWSESGGATRSIGEHFGVSAMYTHISLPASLAASSSDLSAQGVMVVLGWSPLRRN